MSPAFPARGAVSLLITILVAGCADSGSTAASTVAETVCVDTQTGAVVVVPTPAQFPAVHPATGSATLMPGLYCPKCATWHAAPPLEQLHRQHGVAHCPKTGVALQLDGPRPHTTTGG